MGKEEEVQTVEVQVKEGKEFNVGNGIDGYSVMKREDGPFELEARYVDEFPDVLELTSPDVPETTKKAPTKASIAAAAAAASKAAAATS